MEHSAVRKTMTDTRCLQRRRDNSGSILNAMLLTSLVASTSRFCKLTQHGLVVMVHTHTHTDAVESNLCQRRNKWLDLTSIVKLLCLVHNNIVKFRKKRDIFQPFLDFTNDYKFVNGEKSAVLIINVCRTCLLIVQC